MKHFFKFIVLLCISPGLHAQETEVDRLIQNELRMAFPSVHFKHNSVDYAPMPYTADSCFAYIALHYEDNINSLIMWRDSLETEELTNKRIKKLKAGLSKYIRKGEIEIQSMENAQKVSRRIINMTSDEAKISYLLSLNSVLDFSKAQFPGKKSKSFDHILHPKIWCLSCWKNGFHMNKSSRNLRKMNRRRKKEEKL